MSQAKLAHVVTVNSQGGRWQWLYKIGAVAALLSVVIIPLSVVAFFVWPAFPDNILIVIQENWFAGLMGLDFPYVLGNVFGFPFFLILYVTLKKVDESWALIALILGLLGLVCIVPARPIPEMFALSDQYAAAATEAERAIYLAAGEVMLAHFHGMSYHVHYILGSASFLLSSLLMLRSDTFGRATAYVGIVTNIVVFGLYVPVVGVYISALSALGYLIWFIQLGRRLFQLGWGGPEEARKRG